MFKDDRSFSVLLQVLVHLCECLPRSGRFGQIGPSDVVQRWFPHRVSVAQTYLGKQSVRPKLPALLSSIMRDEMEHSTGSVRN